jgi:polyhydroxyalkanoate synthesis regulator phasin
MNRWAELTDFSMFDKNIPCVLCKEKAFITVTQTHFKCEKCDHLFNEDGSPLAENVTCYCEICNPKKKEDTAGAEVNEKVVKAEKELRKTSKQLAKTGKITNEDGTIANEDDIFKHIKSMVGLPSEKVKTKIKKIVPNKKKSKKK